jgi:peptidylprolyl isomerase/FKBP-type peptidyl-prolyl cis-trans isomerase FkpA
MRLLFPLVACVALSACLTSPHECVNNPSNPATEQFASSLGVTIDSMTKTQIGDYTEDLVVGSGATLTVPDSVTIHYSAYLSNGTLVDQMEDQPFTIDLRTQSTIGLADGMIGMNIGGQRLIVAPSQNALGACDAGPVPGNSTLVYKVELLSIGS